VHALVLLFLLVLIHIQLFAKEAVPILLKLGFSSLSNHFTFKLDAVIITLSQESTDSWTSSSLQEGSWGHNHISLVSLLGGSSIWVDRHSFAYPVWKSDCTTFVNLI
jgi:hypothetical protein